MGGLVPLLFVVLALYGSAAAQDSPLVWERVGSVEDAKWLVFYGDTLYTVQYTTQPPTAVLRPGSDDFSRAFAGSVYAYGLLHLSPDTMLTRNLSNVYRTTDGGGSWEKVIDTGTFSNPVETPSGAVLVGTRGNADGHGALVLRSADRGATWTFHGLGNEAGIGTEHVLVVPPRRSGLRGGSSRPGSTGPPTPTTTA